MKTNQSGYIDEREYYYYDDTPKYDPVTDDPKPPWLKVLIAITMVVLVALIVTCYY